MRSSSDSKVSSANRRRQRRLPLDRLVRIPVQIFPVLPFVGPSLEGAVLNLSRGGMALLVKVDGDIRNLDRGARLRVHFRLPNSPLADAKGFITNVSIDRDTGWLRLGIRLVSAPPALAARIDRMVADNESCDERLKKSSDARCDVDCAFHSLCNKSIRQAVRGSRTPPLEIALQRSGR